MADENIPTFMELLNLSAPVTVQLLNAIPAFHDNQAIQALALMGASAALTKAEGMVSREQYLEAAAIIWDRGKAEFETVEVRAN